MERYKTMYGTEVLKVGTIVEKKVTYVVGQTTKGVRFELPEKMFNKLFTKIQEK